MKTYALIIAGGVGSRTQQKIPKQFITIDDKPIIIYTLEQFERNPSVDGIVVSCIDGWQTMLDAYAKQYNISKLDKIVTGGDCRFDSIWNGLNYIRNNGKEDDIVIIHDSTRPLVSKAVINDGIKCANETGSAIAGLPSYDSMFLSSNDGLVDGNIDRNIVFSGQTPETFKLGLIVDVYEEYIKNGTKELASSSMIVEKGGTVSISLAERLNFKITTAEDIEIFKALLKYRNSQP